MANRPPSLTRKALQTRTAILNAAVRMFRERGYEQTTMRAIADECGIGLGTAYYYFRSKEDLVQMFYADVAVEELAAVEHVLSVEREFKTRLYGSISAILTVFEPHHNLAVELFKYAADPCSPLNPFSPESREVRLQAVEVFKRVVEGAADQIPQDLATRLPTLLWTYKMGIVLFWIYDRSPGKVRTAYLARTTCDLISQMIRVFSLPPMKPARSTLLNLLSKLEVGIAPGGVAERGAL